MWKIAVAFLIFAGVALYLLSKAGNIDISGSEQGGETAHVPAVAAPASAPTSASK